MLFDTHCHLNSPQFANDLKIVLDRAMDFNVGYFVVPSYDFLSVENALKLSAQFSNVYPAIGIHPTEAKDWNKEMYKIFSSFLKGNPKIVALGEIGLDYHWNTTPIDKQKFIFENQLALALEQNFPVIVHSREAENDCLKLLIKHQIKNAVFHCYTGPLEVAREILLAGYHISFTGSITYPKNSLLREIVLETPYDKLMIETDAPYLSPYSVRGQRCEPLFLTEIFNTVCEIKKDDSALVEEKILKTSLDFFRIQK